MQIVNIHDAKTHLSKLATEAANGKTFIIAKAGKPLVQVIPYAAEKKVIKRIGFMQEINVPDNFDNILVNEIDKLFTGESE